MTTHKVVKHDEWLKARRRHLAKEKEFTRLRDQLSRERRDLPWELVEKHYTFEGEHGRLSLNDLFEGRGQLVIYHAMFNPDTAGADTTWTADAPCFVCSFWMDNFNGITIHLNHRDITMAAVSLAPYPKLAAFKKRMGWGFRGCHRWEATSTSTIASRSPMMRPRRSITTTGSARGDRPRHPASVCS
jgi:predicted dithiol-disulfide oxidoreductase (DUF899 family)